jgi:hypothetical protein
MQMGLCLRVNAWLACGCAAVIAHRVPPIGGSTAGEARPRHTEVAVSVPAPTALAPVLDLRRI